MGQVVPFIARVRDSGDWSATERARLEELADRLAANGVNVEVIFGATDEGDPWCVVTDEHGDVLIHVARIDGRFVVHSAIDDAVNESVDLQSALRERLEATEEVVAPQSATILPFNVSARQGQTFLALLAATAFFYETASLGDTAEAATPQPLATPPGEPPPPPPVTEAQAQDREVVAQGAVLSDPTDDVKTGVIAPTPVEPAASTVSTSVDDAPPPATQVEEVEAPTAPHPEVIAAARAEDDAPVVILGSDGDDLLVGTAADERIEGGAGNDTLISGGGHDTLMGGAGDDRIELTSTVVAIGGEGADTFVITATVPPPGAGKMLFGVILDFAAGEGDRLLTSLGREIHLPQRPTNPDAPKTDGNGPTTLGPPAGDRDGDFGAQGGNGSFEFGPSTLTRVEVDLDGDGVMDGYVLVGHRDTPMDLDNHPIMLSGQTFSSGDIFG
jgi:hypothetical protein